MHAIAAVALALSTLVVPPDPVTAELRGAVGSGCPEGGFVITTAPDNSSFTLRSGGDGWVGASSGKGTTFRDERKLCQMSVRVNPPEGWTYALGDTEYHGFVDLGRGATGSVRAQAFFQGGTITRSRTWSYAGPFHDNWSRLDQIDIAERVYHPCAEQRNLNINVELRVAKGTSDPETVNHLWRDASETTYGLHWKRCPSN